MTRSTTTLHYSKFFLCRLLLVLGCCLPAVATPWLPFGPDGGDARRFAADPHDHAHLLLGTTNGWLYESHDTGASWRRLSLIGKRDDLILDSIVVDPSDPKHIIVGAYAVDKADGGLYITYDGGANWISQAEMRGQSIRSLSVAPSDSQVWVAGTLKGVYRSTDGARRWKLISPLNSTEIHEVESIAIDPKDPSVIYAGTWHLPWKTSDAGMNWESIKDGIIDDSDVFSIIIDPDKPAVVYASACSGIYKSLNGGTHFDKINGIPSTARRTRVLLQDPSHLATVFAGTTEGLFRTEDAGKQWARTTGLDIIVNDVYVSPGDSQHVLIATDRGGILASDDGGDTFRSSNAGFSSRQITSLRGDRSHPATLFAGVVNDKEWGGVFESDNGGLNWTQRSNGLAGRDVFSLGQAPDGTMLAGTSHGMYLLNRDEDTWERVQLMPKPTAKEAITAVALQPVVPTRAPVPVGRNQFAKTQASHRPEPRPAAHPARGKFQSGHHATQPAKAVSARTSKKIQSGKRQIDSAPHRSTPTTQGQVMQRPLLTSNADASKFAAPSFDGSIFGMATADDVLLATTTEGLIGSKDNGRSWQLLDAGVPTTAWRMLAAAHHEVVAGTPDEIFSSADSGMSWKKLALPESLTRIASVAVEPSGEVWVGGREGIFVSSNRGVTWTTPKNLYLSQVNNIFFDEGSNRVFVTSAGPSEMVFTVQLPSQAVTYTDVGWAVRFVRPVGDHLVAVTPYNGIVIQPKMVSSPMQAAVPARP